MHGSALDRSAAARIALAGMATMFVELTLIRYVPGQVRVLGYFTNFVLLAAFLGFGVGMLASRRWPDARALSWLAPVAPLVVVAAAGVGDAFRVIPSSEQFLFLEYQQGGAGVSIYVFLAVSFCLIASCLVPIGHVVGTTLAGDRPLLRYGLNVAGSLAGIGTFAAASAASTPPWAWILASGVLSCVGLARAPAPPRAVGAAAVAASALIVWWTGGESTWSPYHKVTTATLHVHPARGVVQDWKLARLPDKQRQEVVALGRQEGFVVRVNEDSYQTPVDLGDRALARYPSLGGLRQQYDVVFQAGREVGEVLVLGAGTGNDVAAALRAGARHVDAVEIDPGILALGMDHPERPYADPRVETHVDDARAFLSRTDRTWDFIVFGLLDSHILANAKSNVRLDSFVFTRESFELARRRLGPSGVLVVSHAVGQPWFVDRMRAALAAAFGKPPVVVSDRVFHPLGYVYATGPGVVTGRPLEPGTRILEDDWPFVYLEGPSVPREYLLAMLLIAVISLAAIRSASGRRLRGVDSHFFALGAGFLLLETRGLAVLSVLVGSTWGVTTAVFAGVLVMSLLATVAAAWLVRRERGWMRWALFGLLGVALGLSFAVPLRAFAELSLAPRLALGVLLVSGPLLASGVIFALGLARSGGADRALASNILGALAGGLTEYVSMVTGFRYLLVIAAAFYVLALLVPAGRQFMKQSQSGAGGREKDAPG